LATKKRTPQTSEQQYAEKDLVLKVKTAETKNTSEPKEELQRDLLDDFLFHAANYIYVRRKLFITIMVVLAVAILSTYGSFSYLQYRDNQRDEKLYAIEKIIGNTQIPAAQRLEKAMPLLNQFLEENPDTRQATLALLYRGGLYHANTQFSKAETDLSTVRASQEKDSELYLLASLYLSNVLRDQAKPESAIEILQSAQSGKLSDLLLIEMAELYYQNTQNDKAKEKLEILLKDFPKSPYAEKAKQLLNQL